MVEKVTHYLVFRWFLLLVFELVEDVFCDVHLPQQLACLENTVLGEKKEQGKEMEKRRWVGLEFYAILSHPYI